MNDYDMELIGSFIAERRRLFGYTQTQLAEKVNASFKTVSKWETGHSFPDLCYQVELCKILKITLSELHTGKLNKKLRIKNVLNKVLMVFFLLLLVLLLPAFFYLLNYYNKSYDSFKLYKINGLSNNENIINGYFIEYYEYNTLIIDTQNLENIISNNKPVSIDIYYDDSLIYSFNKPSLESIVIDKEYNIDEKWSFKIRIDNKLLYSGDFYFNSNVTQTPFVEYKTTSIDTNEIIKRLKKNSFKKVSENEYEKVISKNEIIRYCSEDSTLLYKYDDDKISITAYYYSIISVLNGYIYYSNGGKRALVERFEYSYTENELICYVDECHNAEKIIKNVSRYVTLLKGE